MSELTQQQTVSPQQPEEQEIDLIELAQKVWAERKLVFKACGIQGLWHCCHCGFGSGFQHSQGVCNQRHVGTRDWR